jgi:hypothetical protein
LLLFFTLFVSSEVVCSHQHKLLSIPIVNRVIIVNVLYAWLRSISMYDLFVSLMIIVPLLLLVIVFCIHHVYLVALVHLVKSAVQDKNRFD